MASNTTRAAAEARALALALALAARMRWTFGPGPLLSHAFAQFLYVPKPQLLLVPTTSGLAYAMRQVDPVIREARSDALIVSRPAEGSASFAFATWHSCETIWTQPLSLWLHAASEIWLVPPPMDDDPLGFRLRDALHWTEPVPWSDPQARMVGIRRALAWMARIDPS